MKIKVYLVFFLAVVLLTPALVGCGSKPYYPTPVDVTFSELFSRPEQYDGKRVRVIGVGNIEFEGNCIRPGMEDYLYHTHNAVWIELGEKAPSKEEASEYNGKYVIVEGTFDKDEKGHYDMFRGTIKDVSRYELWNFNQDVHLSLNLDETYSYLVTDYKGRTLDEGEDLTERPEYVFVDIDVGGFIFRQGKEPSSCCARYYDLKNSRVSETFRYVLAARDDRVVCAEIRNGEPLIVVRDIFDKDRFYKEYRPENVSKDGDFAIAGKIDRKGNVTVTCLAENGGGEIEFSIAFEPGN